MRLRLPRPAHLLLATSLALPAAVPALIDGPPAIAAAADCERDESVSDAISRISGTSRWATAACVAAVAYPNGVGTVIIARGDTEGGWADALAGTVLSKSSNSPILLTMPDRLPQETEDEIIRLGAQKVVVLGGRSAVSRRVEDRLRTLVPDVTRIEGANRAETAARIAKDANASKTAFIVNGVRPADALVAGAVAARKGAALLLANLDSLPQATLDAFDDLGTTDIVVVGGGGVIGPEVFQQLRNRFGPDKVRRVAGPSRQETAASMARAFPANGTIHLVAAKDRSLVDAIGASWLAARPGGGPVLYADGPILGRGADRWLRLGNLDAGDRIRIIGGEQVVQADVVDQLEDRFREAAAGGIDPQVRGLWVHLFDASLKSPGAIDKVLDAAVAANLNTVIVQTARRHDSYYDTDQIPRTPDPTMPADLDLLETLVPAAHARGLAVHAWYSVMPSYHTAYDGLKMPATHVHETHGPQSAEPWTTDNNDPKYAYMDPGVGGVQDHVVDMLVDVVQRYDVDGVHLDYLRYSSAGAGFHATSVRRFKEQTGAATTDPAFDDWRRRQTADLARRIWLEVTEADPSVTVSMAAIAQGDGPVGPDYEASWETRKAYADKFQDWLGWLDEGIIDAVFPMAYFRESSHASWYDHWVDFVGSLQTRTDRPIAIGQASYLNTVGQSLQQVDQALASTDGLVVYAWQQDSSNAARGELLRHLGATRFAEPAPAPLPTHKMQTADGHALVQARDGVVVTARQGTEVRTMTGDATGKAGFVNLSAGLWTFSASGMSTVNTQVRATKVARVDLR